ncbi:hypothetical protein N7471_006201 [Penicillium samsonianum]|uniref:uncharacterized protein n=1 Tax=Penicillium samsonianum TaxID=1882272 RepID=UPI002548AAC8|nr:uncharacterized protein N7471_006201 [Penicillium samsonianum]KAJ6139715.1 hypothetical protein N7471_006201 [Penicillium samsonianum]
MPDSVAWTIHGYDHDNLLHVVITSTCFAFILSTTAVGFRIISRAINRSGHFLDDWLIILALILEYGISIAGVVLLYNGLGTHIFELSPEQIVAYLKTMKYAVNIVSLSVILWTACGVLAGCFACIPTEKLWHPMVEGGCMNLSKFNYGIQIPNIATDAIILLMPMHIVWNLPISKAKKSGLSEVFVLGFLTLIFDIIRLVVLIQLSTQGDEITYNQVPASVWRCIDPAVGIVAACLTNMRHLFKATNTKVWSRLFGRYITSTSGTSDSQINEKGSWPRQTPSSTGEGSSPSLSGDLNQSPTHNKSTV